MTLVTPSTFSAIFNCCRALEEKKAESINVIDLRGKSSITDFYIIATGMSPPHLRALVRSAEKAILDNSSIQIRSQKDSESGWVVLDGFDFMVHLFDEELRSLYCLEKLWNDAKWVHWKGLESWV